MEFGEIFFYTVILFGAYLLIKNFFSRQAQSAQIPQPQRTRKLPEERDYTLEELHKFDGRNPEDPILLAVKGKIFDVSISNSYVPGNFFFFSPRIF